ncbi:MAG: site-2 protease family protein [Chlorobiaceae bacterium]|jgi:regulator of sigma E protease|nr:site-2 protease family protein [Chlorobiaceae bacterium]
MNMLVSLFAFIFVVSLVVLVHEFGHFLAARKAGVPVYEFSIGFPFSPRIATFCRHKETAFTLRLLPLGGFVSFSADGDEDACKLLGTSRLSRASIMAGGPLFNVVFAFLVFIPAFMVKDGVFLLQAAQSSANALFMVVSGTLSMLGHLFAGQGSAESLSGPLGIAMMAGQAANGGVADLLFFTGVLSISLGIMNLVPFPGLDGGQLMMVLIEAVRNRPLSAKAYQVINVAGIILIFGLSIVITWHDIVKIAS